MFFICEIEIEPEFEGLDVLVDRNEESQRKSSSITSIAYRSSGSLVTQPTAQCYNNLGNMLLQSRSCCSTDPFQTQERGCSVGAVWMQRGCSVGVAWMQRG